MTKLALITATCVLALSACSKPAEPVQNVTATNGAAPLENLVIAEASNAAAPTTSIALEPLKEEDSAGLEPGCACSFSDGTNDLMALAATKAILRIEGKVLTCKITEEQSTALSDGDGSFTCKGYTITLKGEGKVQQMGEDAAGRDGTLTVARGADTKSYKGGMGCAC